MEPLKAEVFAVAPNQWIAVIDGPGGPFSTEAEQPEGVEAAVTAAVREVLGETEAVTLVGKDGMPWSSSQARAALDRAGS